MGTIDVCGLRAIGRHGLLPEEQLRAQPFEIDLRIEADLTKAAATDRVEDTVDYADVCQQVALAAQERSYRTLERLCSAVADRLLDRYAADSVTVKAAKPEPPIPLPVEDVSVEVWKEAPER